MEAQVSVRMVVPLDVPMKELNVDDHLHVVDGKTKPIDVDALEAEQAEIEGLRTDAAFAAESVAHDLAEAIPGVEVLSVVVEEVRDPS